MFSHPLLHPNLARLFARWMLSCREEALIVKRTSLHSLNQHPRHDRPFEDHRTTLLCQRAARGSRSRSCECGPIRNYSLTYNLQSTLLTPIRSSRELVCQLRRFDGWHRLILNPTNGARCPAHNRTHKMLRPIPCVRPNPASPNMTVWHNLSTMTIHQTHSYINLTFKSSRSRLCSWRKIQVKVTETHGQSLVRPRPRTAAKSPQPYLPGA